RADHVRQFHQFFEGSMELKTHAKVTSGFRSPSPRPSPIRPAATCRDVSPKAQAAIVYASRRACSSGASLASDARHGGWERENLRPLVGRSEERRGGEEGREWWGGGE